MKLPITTKELNIIIKLLEERKDQHWGLWAKLWSHKMNLLKNEME